MTMILTKKEIKKQIKDKKIKVTPAPKAIQYQPASLDLRLGNKYIEMDKGAMIDVKKPQQSSTPIEYGEKGMVIPGNTFLLMETQEEIKLPEDICAICQGRSSIGRLGLTVHITAGFVDPGYQGKLTLEVANLSNNNIHLYPGMRICQLIFNQIESTDKYKGKYQKSKTVEKSKINEDKEMKE